MTSMDFNCGRQEFWYNMHTCLSRNRETAERSPHLRVKMNPTSRPSGRFSSISISAWSVSTCDLYAEQSIISYSMNESYIYRYLINQTFVYISTLSSHLLPPNLAQQKKNNDMTSHSIHPQTKIQTFNIMISGPQKKHPHPHPISSRSTLRLTSIHQTFRVECMQRGHLRRAVGLLRGARQRPDIQLQVLPPYRLDDVTAIPGQGGGPF